FTIAVQRKGLWGHFDGSSMRPSGDATAAGVVAWDKDEVNACFLLIQKLPDSILIKYMSYPTAAEM
ncbi:hypothetical protein BDQ17DRAFT_1258965, partial [Cyathus striatus]